MSNELPILLRPANSEDVGFIFNAWLKSFRNSEFASDIANEIYFAEHHKVIEALLKNYEVVIACNKDDNSQIYGFICAGLTDGIFTVNFTYVKHTFRRMGIGKALLDSFDHNDEFVSIYTHKTKSAHSLAKRYNFIYHPYIALAPQLYAQKDSK
jgi:ribosomal protein S18 acetylase RimI-like enzyme